MPHAKKRRGHQEWEADVLESDAMELQTVVHLNLTTVLLFKLLTNLRCSERALAPIS